MTRIRRLRHIIIAMFLAAMPFGGMALIPTPAMALSVPPHTDLVIDQAGVLSSSDQSQLSGSLRRFQAEYGPQIQLLVIPSLEGEPIEAYSLKVAEQYKLGDVKRDDGVLFLVALQDRRMRIEVGQGLEGQLPDIIAGRIIREIVAPYFRQGDYRSGIIAGINAIAKAAGGQLKESPEYSPAPIRRVGLRGFPLFFLLLVIIIIVVRVMAASQNRSGWRSGRYGGWGGGGTWGGGGWGGGSSWGGGGGGFSGGGGGGFSGGGASGSW